MRGVQTSNSSQMLTALLISQDPLFTAAVRTKLDSWGHTVLTATTIDQAMECFHAEPVRLAIIDLDLPNGEGEQLCHQLRASERPGSVYILCYGKAQGRSGTLTALEAQADNFANKPLHPGELRLRLDQAVKLLSQDEDLFQGAGHSLSSGMVSRSSFERFFAVLFAQFQRVGGAGVLLFVDLANRQDIYRDHGFSAAYQTELEIARRLVTVHRTSDFVARIDEGRFCLLLTNTTSLQAHTVAMRVAGALHSLSASTKDNTVLQPRLSLSMADFPGQAHLPQEILEQAERTPVAVLGGAG